MGPDRSRPASGISVRRVGSSSARTLSTVSKPRPGCRVGPADLICVAIGLDDQVDGSVLQVQALAIRQHGGLNAHDLPAFFDQPKCAGSVGHGTPDLEPVLVWPAST